jgi:hypothetical protein
VGGEPLHSLAVRRTDAATGGLVENPLLFHPASLSR